MSDLTEIMPLVQSGGNVALLVCVYFISKVAYRLARIEVMLRMFLSAMGHKEFDNDD